MADSTPLTPDSTARKARRQTSFYPNVNSSNKQEKPFSRSAAKRDSVLALGSIEYLQYFYTKTGLTSKKRPKGGKGPFVPALGPGLSIDTGSTSNIPSLTFDMPPSPVLPPPTIRPMFPPEAPSYTVDPEVLKPGMIQDLQDTERVWSISSQSKSSDAPSNLLEVSNLPSAPEFDVLAVLKTTTRTIRSVRNYLVALPSDHPSHQRRVNPLESFRQKPKRPYVAPRASSAFITPAKPAPPPPPPPLPTVELPDPLVLIRQSALEVLTVLRELEESSRIPLSDDAYDVLSVGSTGSAISRTQTPLGHTRDLPSSPGGYESDVGSRFFASPSPSRRNKSLPRPEIVPLKVQGRAKAVHVWSDLNDDEDGYYDEDKKEGWDDRLVLGGGWLYRNDISPASLTRERQVVERYLGVVDDMLFGTSTPLPPGTRGWDRAKTEVSKPRLKGRSSFGSAHSSPRQKKVELPGRRVASAGLLDAMNELALLTEEPKSMGPVEEEEEEYSEDDSAIPDDDLPIWAKRERFELDPMSRLHSLLVEHLPTELLAFLPISLSPPSSPNPTKSGIATPPLTPSQPPTPLSSQEALLTSLSDGQILCVAYNAVVRKSAKPWGYIQLENVHDLLGVSRIAEPEREREMEMLAGGSKGKGKTNWTFRRTENLRYWIAAMKLRYMIPFTATQPSLNEPPKKHRGDQMMPDPVLSPPVHFDPKLVANRDHGWQDMLQGAVLRWLEAVIAEKRGGGYDYR